MTKRSPIVDPEEPDDTIRIDGAKITAGSITAESITTGSVTIKPNGTMNLMRPDGSIVPLGDAVEFDASEYISKRYGTRKPPSSNKGLFQPIELTWKLTGDDHD